MCTIEEREREREALPETHVAPTSRLLSLSLFLFLPLSLSLSPSFLPLSLPPSLSIFSLPSSLISHLPLLSRYPLFPDSFSSCALDRSLLQPLIRFVHYHTAHHLDPAPLPPSLPLSLTSFPPHPSPLTLVSSVSLAMADRVPQQYAMLNNNFSNAFMGQPQPQPQQQQSLPSVDNQPTIPGVPNSENSRMWQQMQQMRSNGGNPPLSQQQVRILTALPLSTSAFVHAHACSSNF